MFIDSNDVMYHNRPMLRYHIFIDVLEVVDWHVLSKSSPPPSEDSDSS
jgi:hypothetical protein